MISLDTVEAEIIDLEKHDTTYAVVERLAWLYIVRDHLASPASREAVSASGDSVFLTAANGAPMDGVLQVLDEHMDILAALYPKEHDEIIGRIMALK